MNDISGYIFSDSDFNDAHGILLPELIRLLQKYNNFENNKQLFEIGYGNGSTANYLTTRGFEITGVEPSSQGVAQVKKDFPALKLYQGSGYDDLKSSYGEFQIAYSLEVVEHLYDPRQFIKRAYELLNPGGILIMSTPYHGYIKNLTMAILGKMDQHYTALWDNGHIKFWSYKTMRILLEEAGFEVEEFTRVGRIAPIAKSMFVVARK